MDKFLLAAKKMTLAGQGKQPYEYFEAFLVSVQSFPVVAGFMSTYYAIQPTVDVQNIDTLFPYLKSQHPYMLQTVGASPFSGAATPTNPHRQHQKENKKCKTRGMGTAGPTARATTSRQFCWRRARIPCGAMGPASRHGRDPTT